MKSLPLFFFLIFFSDFLAARDFKINRKTHELFENIYGGGIANSTKWDLIFQNLPGINKKKFNYTNDPLDEQIEGILSKYLGNRNFKFKELFLTSLDSFNLTDYLDSDYGLKAFLWQFKKQIGFAGGDLNDEFFKNQINKHVKKCVEKHNLIKECRLELITKLERVEKYFPMGSILLGIKDSDLENLSKIQDLAKAFFSPDPQWKKIGYTLNHCQNKKFGFHEIGDTGEKKPDNNTILDSNCMPDTLYRWASKGYLNFIISNFDDRYQNRKNWKTKFVKRGLPGAEKDMTDVFFSTRSPMSTYGYDWELIRIKLKKGLTFKYYKGGGPNLCSSVSPEDALKTIFVRVMYTMLVPEDSNIEPPPPLKEAYFVEYDFCSMNVVESFSYGRQEDIDELLKDSIWNLEKSLLADGNNHKLNATSYFRTAETGVPYVFFLPGHLADKNVFSKRVLLNRLKYQFISFLRDGPKGIYFNPDVRKEKRIFRVHFSTSHPIFWNPL